MLVKRHKIYSFRFIIDLIFVNLCYYHVSSWILLILRSAIIKNNFLDIRYLLAKCVPNAFCIGRVHL